MRLRLCCNGCIRGRIPDVINSRVYKSAMQKRCINEETTSLTGTIIACLRHWNFSVYISIHGILAIKDKDKQMFKFIAKQKKKRKQINVSTTNSSYGSQTHNHSNNICCFLFKIELMMFRHIYSISSLVHKNYIFLKDRKTKKYDSFKKYSFLSTQLK